MSGRIGPMTAADAKHAYHRLLERVDLGGSNPQGRRRA
jgi:hypothetical protein